MIIVNRIGELISGSVNGKPYSVTYDEKKFSEMERIAKAASEVNTMEEYKALVDEFTPLTKESYKEVIETATPYIWVNKSTNKYYLKHNNVLSSKPLPQLFVDKILQSVEKNIGITPLIKCWVRFLRNPNYTDNKAKLFVEYIGAPYVSEELYQEAIKNGLAEEVAREKSTTTQVGITQEGLLAGYKVSEEIRHKFTLDENEEVKTVSRYKKNVDPDTGIVTYSEPEFAEERLYQPPIMKDRGDAFYSLPYGSMDITGQTPGHFMRVGHTIMLDSWDKVNTNDGITGRPGLHVGGLRYIKGYQNEGTITHNVFIDPMDIGAIVGLGFGNDGAMRVRRYFIHSTFEQVNKNIYHSSRFAALNDAEYDTMVMEAVEKTKMAAAEQDKLLNEKMALSGTPRDGQ